LTVDVFNTADRELTARPVSIGGWPIDDAEPASLTARSWTPIRLTAVPDCEREPTTIFDLSIGGRPVAADLPSYAGEMLAYLRLDHCGTSRQLFVEPSIEATSADDAGLLIELRVPGHGRRRVGDVTITAIASEMLGVVVESDDFPATLPVDGALTLVTRWTVADCGAATRNHVVAAFQLLAADDTRVEAWLGDRGIAVLARYIAVECGP
jgi:hypothetical protein